ncbi:MAG TPA: NAD(P)/FAD-dependent oxidoreductase [Phycisphaerales bacterium]|nr:NAD(P)/FAD-dependent oxidoreductase [Phycisphaerales bacterium]
MERCDVLIVGGGPGGSACARRLSAGGLDVVVLDKRTFPRDKTCAGWITPAVIQELRLDVAEYASSRVLQPITGFRTGLLGGRTILTEYGRPVSYGIRRCEFDHYLLERSGARLMLGEKGETFERAEGGWVVNGSIRAPLLIGAGGHFCPVARMMGGSAAGAARELVVAAQEFEHRMGSQQAAECAVEGAVPELYFCPDLKGYGWCFRKGDHLNVGLGREDSYRFAERAAAFCGLMKEQGRIPRDTPDRFHGHAYILYGHASRPPVGDGVLLVGDAAGLAYPESGEGIRPAVESGMLAAEVVLGARGDYSAQKLRRYAERIRRRFGKPTAASTPAGLALKLRERAAAFLLANRWLSRRVLIERWFLHAHRSALAG